jgi:ankyrin repeat protein
MKLLKIAIAAVCMAGIAAPAAAQNASDGAAFVEAVRKSDGDTAKKLLDSHGKSLADARDYEGNTALVTAIALRSDDWTGFLLNQGADPNLTAKGGETPLIAAARVGYEDAVGWLLSLGAKVDAANKMGETPLIIAVQQRRPRIVNMLLKAGANPDKPDSAAGLTARDYARRDNRSRDNINMIESAKPKAAAPASR